MHPLGRSVKRGTLIEFLALCVFLSKMHTYFIIIDASELFDF